MTELETQTAGNLIVRGDQALWTEEQRAVLSTMGVKEDVSNAELASFLHECQRRRLDPFIGQIHLIGRYDKRAQRNVYKAQTSIDGFRLVARRAADASGIDYEYEDTIWFAPDGTRHNAWLWDSPPAAAKVVVIRNGRRYDAVARYGAYVQTDREGRPSGQWRNMADTMTAKCAEALALRKAFPEDLGGIYTAEEMEQSDNTVIQVQPDQSAADPKKPTRTGPARSAPRPAPSGPSDRSTGAELVNKALLTKLGKTFSTLGVADRDEGLMTIALLTGIKVTNTRELSNDQAKQLLDVLDPLAKQPDPSAALTEALQVAMDAMRADENAGVVEGVIVPEETHAAA